MVIAKHIAEQERRFGQLVGSLVDLGVALVEMGYSGASGKGCIEAITYLDADCDAMELPDEPKGKLNALVEVFICDALPAGWKCDQGSYGTAMIDVLNRTLAFDHTYYVEENDVWHEQW